MQYKPLDASNESNVVNLSVGVELSSRPSVFALRSLAVKGTSKVMVPLIVAVGLTYRGTTIGPFTPAAPWSQQNRITW